LDDPDTSLSLQREKAMDSISHARKSGEKVLLVCKETTGSLHVAICIMYLLWECRLSLHQAIALVQFTVDSIRIPRRLCSYLIHYEAVLHGRNSMMLQDGYIVEKFETGAVEFEVL